MSLKLMYITNRPDVTLIAQQAGVDRLFIDMEYIGKELRQGGLDSVKNHHTIDDIKAVRKVLTTSELLVRINPIHDKTESYYGSEEEINLAIDAGADILMLPYFKTRKEAEKFITYVDGRAKTMLLLETKEAVENIEDILSVPGIDEVHIGLNDLHLDYKKSFMFELLTDGTVDKLVQVIKKHSVPYGFGGIARLGFGMLPAENVIAEHYRLGSSMAILSRSFCDIYKTKDLDTVKQLFITETKKIREYENKLSTENKDFFEKNRLDTIDAVKKIASKKEG